MKISIKDLKRIIKEEIENVSEAEELGQMAAEPAAEPEAKLQSDVEKIKMLIPRIDNRIEMTDLLNVTLKHAMSGKDGIVALRQVLGSSLASAIAKKLGAVV